MYFSDASRRSLCSYSFSDVTQMESNVPDCSRMNVQSTKRSCALSLAQCFGPVLKYCIVRLIKFFILCSLEWFFLLLLPMKLNRKTSSIHRPQRYPALHIIPLVSVPVIHMPFDNVFQNCFIQSRWNCKLRITDESVNTTRYRYSSVQPHASIQQYGELRYVTSFLFLISLMWISLKL